MSEGDCLCALCSFSYFGPLRVKLLLSYFKSAKKVWQATPAELTDVGISPKKALEFEKFRNNFNFHDYFKKLKSLNIGVATIGDASYPENLKDLSDRPPVIYYRGDIKKIDQNAVAIVGSRMMTSYGREVAGKIASELAYYGVTVVSGLALGVDAEAQRSALRAGGRTIAVLASGLDIITPITNRSLALEFIKGEGALISENPLGHIPFRQDFAVRNRLISGLSRAVVVIEGRMQSGTFHTVHAAAIQGRPVFAVPGPITSPGSEGPNYLIQNGAKLVTSTRDIMDELSLEVKVDKDKIQNIMPEGKAEILILRTLDKEPMHLDEIVRISGLETSDVSARLTIMEMKSLVKGIGSGVYKKI